MEAIFEEEAYLAMFAFLDEYYKRTNSSDIGALLGGLSTLGDGMPADPAFWDDWLIAVKRAKAHDVDTRLKLLPR